MGIDSLKSLWDACDGFNGQEGHYAQSVETRLEVGKAIPDNPAWRLLTHVNAQSANERNSTMFKPAFDDLANCG